MKRVIVSLLVPVACSGTGAGTPPPRAAVELVIPPIGAPAATHVAGGERRCTVGLSTGRVQVSSPTCYLDQHVENGGLLTYPCSGEDGDVSAVFDKLVYAGSLRGGEVELEKRTELDWDGDSCRWGTLGTIRGTLLVGGQLTKQKLQWTYADRVIRGSECSGVCRATAIFDVSEAD